MKFVLFQSIISSLIFILSTSLSFSQHQNKCEFCGGKCGTYLNFSNDGREKFLRHIKMNDEEIPMVGQKKYISPGKKFLIHYDTVGFHSPPPKDSNQNGIPDYVDSVAYYFDFVYDVYINQLGLLSPYPDNNHRGSDHYDIYLYDIGNSDDDTTSKTYEQGGVYGITFNASIDYFSFEPFPKAYSFIVIDNDFSELDSIRPLKGKVSPTYKYPGIPSLKVTVAHEFFHAIQFMYGISQPAAITVMEMTAVAMERALFPEVSDYLQYVRRLFQNTSSMPFGFDDPDIGYAHSIFNQYLIEKFGIGIMKKIWENVGQGIEVYGAIDMALNSYGYNMKDAWCEFIQWAYYTGSRVEENISFFSNAKQLPMVDAFSTVSFEPPSKSLSGSLNPFEFRFLRFIFPAGDFVSDDTLDIFLGNTDLLNASNQLGVSRNYLTIVSDSEIPNGTKIGSSNYWNYFETDSNYICTFSKSRSGSITTKIDFAYPNPFRLNNDTYILFPAPENTDLYSKVTLVIYDSEMKQLYSKTHTVSANNNKRVIHLEKLPDGLSSGVYIFGVHNGNEVSIGKFAIIAE